MPPSKTETSIIIPSYNEENYIGKCLESLQKQTYKKYEIIVVDDGSTDKTPQIASSFKGVRVIKGTHQGPGVSRNLGVKNAKGEFLVFVDSDMTFPKEYLKNLLKPMLDDKNVKGTTHDYEVATNTKSPISQLWGIERVRRVQSVSRYIPGMVVFRAMRKSEFIRLGGFDPTYGYADDQTFWLKYRLQPYVAPNTTCFHRNPESLRETYKQSRWIGASLENFWTRLPGINLLVPPFLYLISPFAVPFMALRKSRSYRGTISYRSVFTYVRARYLGTVAGIARRVYHNLNSR